MARPGNRLPSVTLYANQKEVKNAFDIATKSWICHTCNRQFSLLESMGVLNCWQHPGFVQEDGVWSCCGVKMNPARWVKNYPVLRMYDAGTHCRETVVRVRGCQKCDHKTSDEPFTHKDAQPIAELSALLPFLNKEFPFILRSGFDDGLLRRCATRRIVVPQRAAEVEYQDDSGNVTTYDTNEEEVPNGIEISAVDEEENEIRIWWPQRELE